MRDDAALRQCAGTKARLTDDLVFAWRSLTPENGRKRPPGNPASIGLTVSPLASERTATALADAVRLWQEHGHRVVFLVFQQSAIIADDATVFADINTKLASAAVPIEIRRLTANATSIIEAFADIDVVCGMRFHGLVLAAMLERPFVGIVHDNKISEICRRFDMPCHEAATLDGADLVAKCRRHPPEGAGKPVARPKSQAGERKFSCLCITFVLTNAGVAFMFRERTPLGPEMPGAATTLPARLARGMSWGDQ